MDFIPPLKTKQTDRQTRGQTSSENSQSINIKPLTPGSKFKILCQCPLTISPGIYLSGRQVSPQFMLLKHRPEEIIKY